MSQLKTAVQGQYINATAGSKGKIVDPSALVSADQSFSVKQRQTLFRVLRCTYGVSLLATSDLTALSSTTLADLTELGTFYGQAGHWYEAEADIVATNATGADGAQFALKISGTQTSIILAGTGIALNGAAAVTSSIPSVALSSNLPFTLSPDTTSPFAGLMTVRFKLVADATITVQAACKDATTSGLVVEGGSKFTLRCLDL